MKEFGETFQSVRSSKHQNIRVTIFRWPTGAPSPWFTRFHITSTTCWPTRNLAPSNDQQIPPVQSTITSHHRMLPNLVSRTTNRELPTKISLAVFRLSLLHLSKKELTANTMPNLLRCRKNHYYYAQRHLSAKSALARLRFSHRSIPLQSTFWYIEEEFFLRIRAILRPAALD